MNFDKFSCQVYLPVFVILCWSCVLAGVEGETIGKSDDVLTQWVCVWHLNFSWLLLITGTVHIPMILTMSLFVFTGFFKGNISHYSTAQRSNTDLHIRYVKETTLGIVWHISQTKDLKVEILRKCHFYGQIQILWSQPG